MILIGSQALEKYIKLNRKLHDWDFLLTSHELQEWDNKHSKHLVKTTEYSLIYDIEGTIVEIRNPNFLDETDKDLLRQRHLLACRETQFGRVWLPDVQTLYDMKKATALCIDEPKHQYDLKLIENCFDVKQDTSFFVSRLEETMARQKKSGKVKYDFFHKYHIPEYVIHDNIHEMFADLLDINMPTYARLTISEVDISEELFNKLTHEQKISLMVEEVLVLNMERWFIPQMIENGINYRLLDMFYNSNEAMPTYLILKHVCLTGLKGEAKYITDFSKENFFEIEKEWCKAKEKIKAKGGLPSSFFQELFSKREKYRKGEQIAIR